MHQFRRGAGRINENNMSFKIELNSEEYLIIFSALCKRASDYAERAIKEHEIENHLDGSDFQERAEDTVELIGKFIHINSTESVNDKHEFIQEPGFTNELINYLTEASKD